MGRKSREKLARRIERSYSGKQPQLNQPLPWTPFAECDTVGGVDAKSTGHMVYRNSIYTVWIRKINPTKWPEMIHLSIKRNDRQVIHDWRDLQRIKNELVGPEYEAVEIYPAEERLVDSANQYHLWVLADPKLKFPFGFTDARFVSEKSDDGSVQRPWPDDYKPQDLDIHGDKLSLLKEIDGLKARIKHLEGIK